MPLVSFTGPYDVYRGSGVLSLRSSILGAMHALEVDSPVAATGERRLYLI